MRSEGKVRNNPKPQWIEEIYKGTSGQDFLGLVAPSNQLTAYLLPGIITITPRARYYSFYSWLIREYAESHPEGWSLSRFIKRREQIFSLANLAWDEISDDKLDTRGLFGTDKLSQHLIDYRDSGSIPLNRDDYLQASGGGYDSYSAVMNTLEITRDSDRRREIDLLPKGVALAKTFGQAISKTRYFRARKEYDRAAEISRRVLEDYGSRCHISYLSVSPDNPTTIDILFGFDRTDVLPDPNSRKSTTGNMHGTLGLLLDMIDAPRPPLDEDLFRELVAFGSCPDFHSYKPRRALIPFLVHWRMFQLREMYVYCLYALWSYFLIWLRDNGPASYDDFMEHLNAHIHFDSIEVLVGHSLPQASFSQIPLANWLDEILDCSGIGSGEFMDRCLDYAKRAIAPINEISLIRTMQASRDLDRAGSATLAIVVLSSLFMRLCGIRVENPYAVWRWSKEGDARRRSLNLFVENWSSRMNEGASLLDTIRVEIQESIIAQHILTALDKWRQRSVNTFHFNYEHGLFEWVEHDRGGYSSSRFAQALTMLRDMGLFRSGGGEGQAELTDLGVLTLERTIRALNDS